MVSSKRPRNDENTSLSFVDQFTPVSKCLWLRAQAFTLAEIKNLQQEWAQKDQAAADAKAHADEKSCVEQVLGNVTALHGFVDELLNVRSQQLLSCVSKMLGQHGEAILNSIRARQPDIVKQWAVGVSSTFFVPCLLSNLLLWVLITAICLALKTS